jgi:hypothetical protein
MNVTVDPSELVYATITAAPGIDRRASLIYRITVRDEAVYIGKSLSGHGRPLRAYWKNVRDLRNGIPYRNNDDGLYRRVHYAMATAFERGAPIDLHLLENTLRDKRALKAREDHWQAVYDRLAADGGLRCLHNQPRGPG